MGGWKGMRGRILGLVLAAAVAAVGVVFGGRGAWAGPNIWTPTGPRALEGLVARDNLGGVYAVAAGAIEATYNGLPATTVYKSTDGGESWRVVGDYGAASGGEYPVPLYLATSADGRVLMLNVFLGNSLPLLKSSDGGATWREVVAYFETNNLVIDPSDSNRMYANGKDGFHRSTDGGVNWEYMSTTAPPRGAILAGRIAVNPARPANLLAVTDDGVRVSNDYGESWETVAPRPDPDLPPEERRVPSSVGGLMLTFVARAGGDSWAVAVDSEGVWISKDGGRTWSRGRYAGKTLRGFVSGLDAAGERMYMAFGPYGTEAYGEPPRRLALTLFTSTDGENWTEVGPLPLRKVLPGGSPTGVIFASQVTPGRIFRGDGVVSNDGGRTWGGLGRGLPLRELAVQSFSRWGAHWFAGAGLNIYRTSDNGANWTQMAPQGEVADGTLGNYYESITGVGVQGDLILAHLFPHLVTGGPGGHYIRPATVVRSTDAGATWTTGIATNGREARFAFYGSTVYMAVSPIVRTLGTRYTTSGPGGLFKSVDSGATWVQLPVDMPVNNVIVERADGNHLFAAGNEGLAESRDGGATWRRVRTNPQVGGLVFSGSESFERLYAYGAEGLDEREGIRRGGLYTSTDGGRTWAGLAIGGLAAQEYRVVSYGLGESGHLVLAWTPRQGGGVRVSQSSDGGSMWSELTGLGLQGNIQSLYFDSWAGLAIAQGPGLQSYQTVMADADAAFARVWRRQDEPVSAQVAQRSWTWGAAPFSTIAEPLEGVPGNNRRVQYWDKSRMEVNDPGGDRDSPWFVTNGLLTVEMVAGRVQTGLNKWEARAPSLVPVAGDGERAANPNAPTYASFRGVASYEEDNNRAGNRVGQQVTQSIDARGNVGASASVPAGANVTLAAYDGQSGHNIAGPFWEFLNRRGPVAEGPGQYVMGPIFGDWVFVMGHPISEPYWASVRVGGEDRAVLVQLFERRVLTYTPGNEAQWQVEMGNVGLHYYVWRYGR